VREYSFSSYYSEPNASFKGQDSTVMLKGKAKRTKIPEILSLFEKLEAVYNSYGNSEFSTNSLSVNYAFEDLGFLFTPGELIH